jgi:hypothetical protein
LPPPGAFALGAFGFAALAFFACSLRLLNFAHFFSPLFSFSQGDSNSLPLRVTLFL